MRRLSISTRLALWYGLSLMLLLGLVAAFLYGGFHLTLHRDFDADLANEAQRLSAALAAGSPAGAEAVPPGFVRAAEASPYAVRLLERSGAVRYANGRLPGMAVHPPLSERANYHTHGDEVRTRYVPVRNGSGALVAWVAVAGIESGLHREMHRLGWLLALGVLLGVGVAALSGYGLARRALRPVAALTDAARRIGPGVRLPTAPPPHDELGDLAAAFNALLARLDDAFERERQFRADAAHELLTPVTAARSEIDIALRRPRDADQYREVLATLGELVDRMTRHITGLLALSRAEAAHPRAPRAVDLGEIARQRATLAELSAQAKGVVLTWDAASGVAAAATPEHVETMIDNLLDNAIKYTPPGGTVTVSVSRQDAEAVVSVTDTGVGFTEVQGGHLFGRFYRADAPEVQRERGSGLGLAIVQRLAQLHEGRITAASAGRGRGSVFEIRLPAGRRSHTGRQSGLS